MLVDDTWFKPQIDRKTLKNLSRRSNWAGAKHFLIYFTSLIFFGYLTAISWGTLWCVLWIFIYGTIWAYSPSNWHETLHRTAFKSRLANDVFYYISSFMGNFEPIRWRWSHTFHHSHTLQTHDDYDFEIQVERPTDLIHFFIQFIPFGQLLYPHKTLQAEVIKHAFGNLTEVVKQNAPENDKNKIIWNSRFFILIWIGIIYYS
ncbi:fatty acid desaturase, partial [Alphaproteobacteria bacterium]|nr:fatty acid desaturase [Alphaproteobacteria bacterium]